MKGRIAEYFPVNFLGALFDLGTGRLTAPPAIGMFNGPRIGPWGFAMLKGAAGSWGEGLTRVGGSDGGDGVREMDEIVGLALDMECPVLSESGVQQEFGH